MHHQNGYKEAYDLVSWQCLEQLLLYYELPSLFYKIGYACVTTARFCQLYGFFGSNRGLMQSDPMSPLLFVLVIESLIRALKIATESEHF